MYSCSPSNSGLTDGLYIATEKRNNETLLFGRSFFFGEKYKSFRKTKYINLIFYDFQVPSPTLMGKVPKNRVKTKQCWFHSNHAQGCPLPSTLCVYAHGQDDLQNNQGP